MIETRSLKAWWRVLAITSFAFAAAYVSPRPASADEPSATAPSSAPAAKAPAAGEKPPRPDTWGCRQTADPNASIFPALAGRTTAGESPSLWPDLGLNTIAWFAVVAILALLLRSRPWWRVTNLDALVLAAMAVLLVARTDTIPAVGMTRSPQWWAYAGLTAAAVYWLLRGMRRLLATGAPKYELGAAPGVLTVFLVAGLVLSINQVISAPITQGSEDGMVGGTFVASSGYLPYGDTTQCDSRSPLLYLLHAGALRFVEPNQYLAEERVVGLALLILLIVALYLLGRRLHSDVAGCTLVALVCLFPGTVEQLGRPQVMLPAVLLAWSILLSLLPGVGGLLGMFLLVVTGVAWPWAWLALPVALGWFWRRRWHSIGGLLGLAGGVAVIVAGLLHLVQPTIPRADGALELAGLRPEYRAHFDAKSSTITMDRLSEEPASSTALTSRAWRWLVTSDTVSLRSAREGAPGWRLDWPNDAGAEGSVHYWQIKPDMSAGGALLADYRKAMNAQPAQQRLLANLRTVLEATWRPVNPPKSRLPEAWTFWGGPSPQDKRTIFAHRAVKAVVGLIAVWVTLALCLGRRTQPRQLLGGLLMVISGAMVASAAGAVTNLVWLVPLVLALGFAHDAPAPSAAAPAKPSPLPPIAGPPPGPEPRITVNP